MACSSCGKTKTAYIAPDGSLSRADAIAERNRKQGYQKMTVQTVNKKALTKAEIRATKMAALLGK